jgi:DNA repair protein RadC
MLSCWRCFCASARRQDVLSYAQALLQRFGFYALLSADKAQLVAVDGWGWRNMRN